VGKVLRKKNRWEDCKIVLENAGFFFLCKDTEVVYLLYVKQSFLRSLMTLFMDIVLI